MFYILVFLGFVLMGLGIYKEKNIISSSLLNMLAYSAVPKEVTELEQRVSNIESIMFSDFMERKEAKIRRDEHEEFEHESIDTPLNGIEKYKLLCRYEEENRTFEEICTLLDMRKGEILLLKNLYKDFQK